MDNYWQTEHTGDYSCLTITTLLFIIVLSISLYITYEPRRDLAILPDQRKTVFPRTVRRVQCVSLGGGWVVSAWSTVLRGILRPYITAPRERRHWRLNLGGAGRRTGRSGCRQLPSLLQAGCCGGRVAETEPSTPRSEPDQMFITMDILFTHHWNIFSEVMGKSNIFHLNHKWECA